MQSNTELLKVELASRKEGEVQTTIIELAVKYGRNRRHLLDSLKLLAQTGIIKVSKLGMWRYNNNKRS